jgi:hypothetical protein
MPVHLAKGHSEVLKEKVKSLSKQSGYMNVNQTQFMGSIGMVRSTEQVVLKPVGVVHTRFLFVLRLHDFERSHSDFHIYFLHFLEKGISFRTCFQKGG